jgi:hypothetical protein
MKHKMFVLELERGDTATGLFFEGSCLVPAPDKALKFDSNLVACMRANMETTLRDKIGERYIVSEVEMVSATSWRRICADCRRANEN